MGKRQIGDMQPNELVITLLISEIAAMPLQDTSQPLLNGICSVFMLVILEIIISVITMKSVFIRKLMNGKSVVLIKNGVVDQTAMKSVRITVLDLIELLRGQEVFDVSKVAYAILEVNGDLSVLLKSAEQPATVKDFNLTPDNDTLPLPVISDGKILYDSLKALEITKEELQKSLKKNKTTTQKVFLMTMDRDKNCNIINKR